MKDDDLIRLAEEEIAKARKGNVYLLNLGLIKIFEKTVDRLKQMKKRLKS
jgi:hypothetical protein